MKANNGTGNNESRDDWETPQELWDKLNKQYDFAMDWCASESNHKTELWTDDIKNTGVLPETMCWMNPPFSKAKEMFTEFFKRTPLGVAIYRCDNMETKVWQEVILKKATWIFIPKGIIFYQYNPNLRNGQGSRFPSAFIGLNVEPPKNFDGVVLWLKSPSVKSEDSFIKEEGN